MRKLSCFNGAVSRGLLANGYDASKVLAAVNAVICSIEPDESKTVVTAKATLAGRVTEKNGDKRTVTVTETEKRKSDKIAYSPQLALYALSTAADSLVDRHGVVFEITAFAPDVALWLNRDTFRLEETKRTETPVVGEPA